MFQQILLMSQIKFQNKTLHYIINKDFEIPCTLCDPVNHEDLLQDGSSKESLLLWDFLGNDNENLWDALFRGNGNRAFENRVFAIYNFKRNDSIEKKLLKLGTSGVFYEDCDMDHFKKGVQALKNGELWFSRQILNEFIIEVIHDGYSKQKHAQSSRIRLTRREKEILIMVSSGKSNQEIAETLYISTSTVKTHIYNIFQKIEVPNRIQAALWTVKNIGLS